MVNSHSLEDPSVFERHRLALLAALLDPLSEARFNRIGVGSGWQCLDVGAGQGSVAKLLAARVGTGGRVVATDIDTRFLDSLNSPNVETRRHNIVEDELEGDQFDLVHCRALLMHLNDPELAVERMVAALRPGGWILVEEIDELEFGAVDPDSPDGKEFDRINRIVHTSLRQWRVMDMAVGRRLRGKLDKLGLVDVGHEGLVSVTRGGEPGAEFQRMNLQFFHPLIRAGLLTEADIQTLDRFYSSPDFEFTGGTCFGAWGRKPG